MSEGKTKTASKTRADTGATEKKTAITQRLRSLDVLRGLTVAIMIMVNNSGDGSYTYRLLAHSPWNGCTLADVVFPCFLFMVGLSSVFSIRGRLNRATPRGVIVRRAATRSMIIFALGLGINGFPVFSLDTLRVFGVLQRIALCYFVVVLFLLFGGKRTIATSLLVILIGYWVLLRWVPVPGMGTPGSTVPFLDPHANMPAWLDRHLLPATHLYHQGFYDPEGFLSSLSAIATTLIGALTGIWILGKRELSVTARGLLAASSFCLATGLLWSHWFPLNKRLWTSSFVLWTAGISLLSLWLFFKVVDVHQLGRRWIYPSVVFGTNALAAYVFSEFLASLLQAIHLPSGWSLQRWVFQPIAAAIPNQRIASLAYAVAFVAVCFVPPWIMYRKQVFLKV